MRAAVTLLIRNAQPFTQGAHRRDAPLVFALCYMFTPALLANPQYASASEQTRASLRIFHQKVTVRLPEPHAFLQLFSALL